MLKNGKSDDSKDISGSVFFIRRKSIIGPEHSSISALPGLDSKKNHPQLINI
jgi:hypothetical protein